MAARAVVVALVLAGWLCTLGAEARERLQITTPREGARVMRVVTVKGTVRLREGEVLVILARHAEFGWWYQGQTDVSGPFEIEPVYIGRPSEASGARFSIAGFIVPATRAAEMKEYRAKLGVPVSPEKMITVYRL